MSLFDFFRRHGTQQGSMGSQDEKVLARLLSPALAGS